MARISELHYSNAYARNSGVAEFLEVALGPADDPADFTVSFYDATGLVGAEYTLDDPRIQVSVDPDNGEVVYVLSADFLPILLTDPDSSSANNYEAFALTDQSGGAAVVLDFYDIGGGTTNIVAQDGLAQGETSQNLTVLVGPDATTTTLQFNQPDPDTLVHAPLGPGDTGIACFTAGTPIDTPDGPRAIETLRPGDLVSTLDDGPQPLRWCGQTCVDGRGRFAPVRIGAGALGARRDIAVSPQHRVLVQGWQAELHFGETAILIPAHALIDGAAIRRAPVARVCYVHLLFDRHQVLTAGGLASESFYPGAQGLSALEAATRDEVLALFPHLRADPAGYGPAARPLAAAFEGRLLLAA